MPFIQKITRFQAALIAAFFISVSSAKAFPVTVNPGTYSGEYRVSGAGPFTGSITLDLAEGAQNITFPPASGFNFEVDPSGNVINISHGAATAAGAALNFNTQEITIDPGSYAGTYRVLPIDTVSTAGVQMVTAVKGVALWPIRLGHSNFIQFDLDAMGNVTNTKLPGAATASGSTLTFNTVEITVDPADFTNPYRIQDVESADAAGVRKVTLVKDVIDWSVRLGHSNSISFDTDASGGLTDIKRPGSATATGPVLTFNTGLITINPGNYSGEYRLQPFDAAPVTGIQTYTIVKDVTLWTLNFPHAAGMNFDVDAAGNIFNVKFPGAATSSGSTLTFNTALITFDPRNYIGTYEPQSISPAIAGVNSFNVVKDVLNYTMIITHGAGFFFNVDSGGNVVSQNAVAASSSGGAMTFNTTAIQVDPNGYSGSYVLRDVDPASQSGVQTFQLLPGLSNYNLDISPGVGGQFSVDASGAAIPSVLPINIGGTVFDFLLTPASTGPLALETTADSFLRQGAKDRNEGANPMMRVRKSGKNRAVIQFDAAAIASFGTVSKATLVLNIRDIGNNWGSGRVVDAHALNVPFVEGDGKAAGVPNSETTRGNGSGATWKCAVDTAIENQQTDCSPTWLGGDFVPATAAGQIHTSGQTGPVQWDVTADVWNGANAWLIKKAEEGQNGRVEYYSREGALEAGDPALTPTLILE